jgi:hypothetical protein
MIAYFIDVYDPTIPETPADAADAGVARISRHAACSGIMAAGRSMSSSSVKAAAALLLLLVPLLVLLLVCGEWPSTLPRSPVPPVSHMSGARARDKFETRTKKEQNQ